MGRNRIELTGRLACAPQVRTTPAGTPILRIEVDCGEGRESLILGVVMAGEGVRELGARIGAGSTVKVTGTLRTVGRGSRRSRIECVEVLADSIGELAERPGSGNR